MIMEVVGDVICLRGSLLHNCWPMLESKCQKVVKQYGHATVYCEGVTDYTEDGLQTLARAMLFSLESAADVQLTGLSDALWKAMDEALAVAEQAATMPRAS